MEEIEIKYCPIYPLKIYSLNGDEISRVETKVLEINSSIEECHVVWLNGRYTRVPFGTSFFSPTGNPSRQQSYTKLGILPDIYYSSTISDVVHTCKVQIYTQNIRPLHLGLKSGPIYIHIVTIEN